MAIHYGKRLSGRGTTPKSRLNHHDCVRAQVHSMASFGRNACRQKLGNMDCGDKVELLMSLLI